MAGDAARHTLIVSLQITSLNSVMVDRPSIPKMGNASAARTTP